MQETVQECHKTSWDRPKYTARIKSKPYNAPWAQFWHHFDDQITRNALIKNLTGPEDTRLSFYFISLLFSFILEAPLRINHLFPVQSYFWVISMNQTITVMVVSACSTRLLIAFHQSSLKDWIGVILISWTTIHNFSYLIRIHFSVKNST